jgi:hypothetical protein
MEAAMYRLIIYELDARTIARETIHATHKQARRSLYDYERRHGRRPAVIQRDVQPPNTSDARSWEQWRAEMEL